MWKLTACSMHESISRRRFTEYLFSIEDSLDSCSQASMRTKIEGKKHAFHASNKTTRYETSVSLAVWLGGPFVSRLGKRFIPISQTPSSNAG